MGILVVESRNQQYESRMSMSNTSCLPVLTRERLEPTIRAVIGIPNIKRIKIIQMFNINSIIFNNSVYVWENSQRSRFSVNNHFFVELN